jgi:hypothetical protein
MMAVDGQGTLYLLYSPDFGDPHYLRVRRAGVWSPWGKITEDNTTTSLAMVADPGGHIHILEGPIYSGEWGFKYYTDQVPVEDSLHWIRQSVQIPAGMNRPTLSFWYSLSEGSPGAASRLSVRVESAPGAAEVFSTREQTGWKHAWVDLSPWAGQAVTVAFELQQAKGEFYRSAGLDDVSLGSWLTPTVRQVDDPWVEADWAGQVITLSGENLLPGITVRVGSTLAERVEWVDEFTLRVTLPSGLVMGHYDLWVTNPGGQAGALPSGLHLGRFLFLPVIHR